MSIELGNPEHLLRRLLPRSFRGEGPDEISIERTLLRAVLGIKCPVIDGRCDLQWRGFDVVLGHVGPPPSHILDLLPPPPTTGMGSDILAMVDMYMRIEITTMEVASTAGLRIDVDGAVEGKLAVLSVLARDVELTRLALNACSLHVCIVGANLQAVAHAPRVLWWLSFQDCDKEPLEIDVKGVTAMQPSICRFLRRYLSRPHLVDVSI